MRPSFAIAARFLFVFAVVFVLLQTGFARERGPRVEVVCPMPPIPVKLAEQQVLVYELHITNFDAVPLTLKRVEVFAGTDESQPLKTISGDALAATMLKAGSMMSGSGDPQITVPGSRSVVFLWIELGPDKQIPANLSHRMVFAAGTPGEGRTLAETTLEDFPVPVDQGPVPLLSSPFDGGVWLAGDLANDSDHRRSIVAIDGHIHAPERFAIDWVKVGSHGDTHLDGTARNENWWGYGVPIHSVAVGK